MKQIHTVGLMWIDLMRKECLHTTSEIKFACIITNTDATQEELWYVTWKVSQLVYIYVAYILTGNFSDTMQLNASWSPPPFSQTVHIYLKTLCRRNVMKYNVNWKTFSDLAIHSHRVQGLWDLMHCKCEVKFSRPPINANYVSY